MVALLFPAAELLAVLVHGAVYDPTYRPFPGGRFDLEDDFLWHEDDEDDEDEQKSGASSTKPSVGSVVSNAPSMRLDLMASHWRRHDSAMGVLVAGTSESPGPLVHGLVRVEAGPRIATTGFRHGTITDRAIFTSPVLLNDVVDAVPARHAGTVRGIVLDGASRPLPPGAGVAFLDSLRAMVDGVQDTAAVLDRGPRVRVLREGRTAFRFDAVTTALRVFEPEWRSLGPVATPEDPPDDVTELVRLYEREAITDDAGVLPGWERSRQTSAGWWEFRSGDRRLRVKNLDATHYEAKSGADLVYMRRDPDAFVLVQYKMLSSTESGGWEYVEDDRLSGQIMRMQAICRPTVVERPNPDTYRLGPGATFVKLVEPPRSPRDADALLPGYYLPTEYLSFLLPQPGPPKPARRVAAPPARYLDAEVFVRLVGDSWVGTLSDASQRLREYFLSTGGSPITTDLTFAYEEARPH